MTWVPMVICCYIFMLNMVRHDFQLFFYNIYELHVYDMGSDSDMLLPSLNFDSVINLIFSLLLSMS